MEPMSYIPVQPFFGVPRSSKWELVRSVHLEAHDRCEVCGSARLLNVHHKKPYHLFPELELDPTNLITLCEGQSVNCHLLFGHLKNWSSYNKDIDRDVAEWRKKILNRPARFFELTTE